nr:MAG TPA: hypothetical protein [Caudoviricetes sp.]
MTIVIIILIKVKILLFLGLKYYEIEFLEMYGCYL